MAAFNPRYYGIPPTQQILTENRFNYTASLNQTTFAASYPIGYVDVYYNGAHLDPRTAFAATDGTSIVLSFGAALNASVVIVARPQVPVSNVYGQSDVNALVTTYASTVAGTGDALTATTSPNFTAFRDGMHVGVRMTSLVNATTTPTIAFNGLSAKPIVGQSQSVLPIHAWQANSEVTFVYNATAGNFTLYEGIGPTITQVQSGSLYSVVATGTSDALVATFIPAITAVANQTILVRAVSANTTTAPTINPGSGVLTIVKGNNLPLAIGDIAGAGHWLEITLDSTLTKAVLLNPAGGVSIPSFGKRQTVMSGPVDANGLANEIGVGTGLAPTLIGSVTPVAMTFAAGFGANGGIDYNNLVSSTLSFPAVPASNLSYLTVDRNTTTGALTLGSTLAPPQYGTTYTQNAQSVLQFGGAAGSTTFLDDFGNTWTAQSGAKVQTNQVKFGTGALGGSGTSNALNASSDYIKSTSFTNLGQGGWTLRAWVYWSGFPSATNGVYGVANASAFGVFFSANSAGKTRLDLSSGGASFDVANGTLGTVTLTTGQYYHTAITFDAVAGKYFLYINGVVDQTITSTARICSIVNAFVGQSGNNSYHSGYIDKFEFLPYCAYPNGTTFTVPIAAPNVATQGYASDWFNTANYTMNQVSAASTVAGTNPTFTPKQRLYVGEATAGATTVSSVVSYAYNGQYDSLWFPIAVATVYLKSHNLGVKPLFFKSWGSDAGLANEGEWMYVRNYSAVAYGGAWLVTPKSNSISLITDQPVRVMTNSATPNYADAVQARITVNRGW